MYIPNSNYSLNYYNSVIELQAKFKALSRLFKIRKTAKNRS